MSLDILVVDDEADIRNLISENLKDESFIVRTAANSAQVFELINERVPNALILDIWLQGSDLDGLGILEIIKKKFPLMPIVVISGHGTVETAVAAIKMGAYDYIEKPFTHEKLMIVLKRACESAKLKKENSELKAKVNDKHDIVGNSVSISKLKIEIMKVAPTSGRVMLFGQNGTGKHMVAKLIHKHSKRSSFPFITFSPTNMDSERVMLELFGSDRPDSPQSRKPSILESANNGTLYLEEIGDLPYQAQTKLVKFLQNQVIEKPWISKSIKLDVRFITSTTRDLQSEVSSDKFRQDLFYRLNVIPIKVPSLSERSDDIPDLVSYFVTQLAKYSGLKEREFADDAILTLQAYSWPGNVRQLRNAIEWALIMNPMSNGDNLIVKSDMLPPEILQDSSSAVIKSDSTSTDMMSMPLREAREIFERQYLAAQMNRFNNNISKTSSFVGMERSALHRKLKLLNIHSTNRQKNNLLKREDSRIEEMA